VKVRKARIRAKDKKWLAIISFLVIFIAGLSSLAYWQNSMVSTPSGPRAAIVDQLSLTAPNQTFVDTATAMLKQAGYAVDYYSGDQVTVDCYRNLASLGYGIILLRVHCGYSPTRQTISFFTSEVYSPSEYSVDQLAGYLHEDFFVYPPPDGEPGYFSITPSFVENAMSGRFNGTTVIMMGCYGLMYPVMAEAFVAKGAKVYISWNGSVESDHTDEATITLLQHLTVENQPVAEAVKNTLEAVGEDPEYNSTLTYYPQS
jgi:hypothetical protein